MFPQGQDGPSGQCVSIKTNENNQGKRVYLSEATFKYFHSFKYFIGYNGKSAIKPLCKKLPQMIGYVRKFEGNTTMSF